MKEPIAYLNGEHIPVSQATLPVYDSGVVLGATVTEMTRTFGHQLFKLNDHLDRLFQALEYMQFDTGLTKKDFRQLSIEIVKNNAQWLDKEGDLGLTHFVTAGTFATYAKISPEGHINRPTVCIHTFPLPFSMWAEKLEAGQQLVTPNIRHVPPQCYDPAIKNRSRLHYYLADLEARRVVPGATALLLDMDDHVTETIAANFIMVRDRTLISPEIKNILPGISRKTVFELASDLGLQTVEQDITVEEVIEADEAFTTSTSYCMMPVTHINNAPIGKGKPGPVYRTLIDAWSKQVGVNITTQITSHGTAF